MKNARHRLYLPIVVSLCALLSISAAPRKGRTPAKASQSKQDPAAKIRVLKQEIDKLMVQLPQSVQVELRKELARPPSRRAQPARPTGKRLPPKQEQLKIKILKLKNQIDKLMVKLPPLTQAQLRRELIRPPKPKPGQPMTGQPPRQTSAGPAAQTATWHIDFQAARGSVQQDSEPAASDRRVDAQAAASDPGKAEE